MLGNLQRLQTVVGMSGSYFLSEYKDAVRHNSPQSILVFIGESFMGLIRMEISFAPIKLKDAVQ
jgi:hypothetical protein